MVLNFCLKKYKEGNLKGEYPDKNNHTIDAVRYGMEDEIRGSSMSVLK